MIQQFNPMRVLRQVSASLLQEFCRQQGYSLHIEGSPPTAVAAAWPQWPPELRSAAEIVFHQIHTMANEDGVALIIEEGRHHGEDLVPLLEPLGGRHDQVLWTAMHRPAIWEAALLARAEACWAGRPWIKRGNLPAVTPRTDEAALNQFQQELSTFYQSRQGRGAHGRVEYLARQADQHTYFAYLSDYGDTYPSFDPAGDIQRIRERRTFGLVFAYDRPAGTLEICAKGGRSVIQPLQHLFTRTILGQPLAPEAPGRPPYRLDVLLDRSVAFPTDPQDRIEEVRIRSLRLAILGGRRGQIILRPDPQAGPEPLGHMLDHYLSLRLLPRSILQATRATFCFRFYGQQRPLTFQVVCPNGCDLWAKRDDHRRLGQKYLRRWGIDVS